MKALASPRLRLGAFALVSLAAMLSSSGCQNSGSDSGPAVAADTRMPPPERTRGGDSPAVRASGRADGGVDRQTTPAGSTRYTLAYPTGDRATSVILLEAVGPDRGARGSAVQAYAEGDEPHRHAAARRGDPQAADGADGHASRHARPAERRREPLRRAARRPAPPARTRLGSLPGRRPAQQGTDAAQAQPAEDAPTAVWRVGILNPRQSQTRELTEVADEVGTSSSCLSVSYNPAMCVAMRVVKPEIAVTKEGPSEVLICQDINYTYRVTNTGTGAVQNVRLEDTLPEGLATAEGGRRGRRGRGRRCVRARRRT